MTRDKALEILDTLLAKTSLDQELREALSMLMDEVVVNNRKVSLLTKALTEAEDRVAALQLDLGVKDGLVTAMRPKEGLAGNGQAGGNNGHAAGGRDSVAGSRDYAEGNKEQGSGTDAAVGVVGVGAVGGSMN